MSPRSKVQFEAMREKSREKIINAALKLFAEKGYYSTSMDDVVKKAKVSKGSAYHYFKSKEALLKAVMVRGMSEFESMMGVIESKLSPEERLETLINISFDMLLEDIRLWRLYFSLITQVNLPKSIRKVVTPIIEGLLIYMKDLLEKTGVQNAESEARILGAIMDGVFVHYLLIGERYPLNEVRENIVRRYVKERK